MKAPLQGLIMACLLASAASGLAQELFWGENAEGFQLALGFDKVDFQKGEAILAFVVLKNTSDVGRNLRSFHPPDRNHDFAVTRAQNEIVEPIPRTPAMGKLFIEAISPHGAKTNQIRLDAQFDLKAPGTYVVTASQIVPTMSESQKEFPSTLGWIRIQSGKASIRVLEGASGVAADGFPSSTPSQATQTTIRKSAPNSTGTPTGNSNSPSLQNNSAPAGSSSNVVQSLDETTSRSLASASPRTDTRRFTFAQKLGTGIIVALLAVVLVMLWRASRRKSNG